MKKKLVTSILMFAIAFGMCACGKEPVQQEIDVDIEDQIVSVEDDVGVEGEESQEEKIVDETESVSSAAEMRLKREQIRSKNKESLLEIVNDASVAEDLKKEAINKMIAMTDIAEREVAAEMLLEAKGFSDVAVCITDDCCDVVINMGEVTDAEQAQVEDIVKRKTNVEADKIVIIPIVIGEADTSNYIDYAEEMKLKREQIRSKNKESLLEIVNNTSVAERLKQEPLNKMIAMTDIAEREAAAEMLLEAKGFSDVVVIITDDSCDAVINMGEVTDAKRAQIEDIVKRKTNVPADKIVITPIMIEEADTSN